jgi:diguanylate cyclase (GGDEF)-like protein/PAS domain S-box-containing protein
MRYIGLGVWEEPMPAGKKLRILYVDGSPAGLEVVRAALRESIDAFDLAMAADLPDFEALLRTGDWDFLLSDFHPSSYRSVQVMDAVHALARARDDSDPEVAGRRLQTEEALRAGQSTIRSFFDRAPFQMGITEMTADNDMLLVVVNHAAAAAIGCSPEMVHGKRISELGLTGPNRGIWLDQYLQALQIRQPVHFEQEALLPGKVEWWAVTLAYIGEGPSGRPRFSYVLQDITERKRDERTQAALLQISEAAQSVSALPELFGRIHEIIDGLLPARNFFVALYDEARDELSFPYFVDEHDPAPPTQGLEDGTLAGRVIKLGQALLFTPETPREGKHEEATIVGTESLDWLGVPLKSASRTIGALVVQSYAGGVRYTEKDKRLLEFVSSQVATAIMRKQVEEAILASEARFRLLFEQNLAGVFRSRADGCILECNDAFARMLGFDSREEALAVNASTLYFSPADRQAYLDELHDKGSVNNFVARFRRKDGRELWGLETVNVLLEGADKSEIFQGTLVDFTDRRRSEEALKLSESRLEEAQRVAHLGSWNWDLANQALNWSDELCRIYGVEPGLHSPSYEDFLDRIHPEDRAGVQALVTQALADRKPFSHETRILRPDGEVRIILDQAEVLLDEHGDVAGMAGACLDITIRKRAELLERDRSHVLELVAQNEPLPVILEFIGKLLEHQRPELMACVHLVREGRLFLGSRGAASGPDMDKIQGLLAGPGNGSFAEAAATAQPVVASDTRVHPSWSNLRDSVQHEGIRSWWSYPIRSADGNVLGTISLFGAEPRQASAADLQLLESTARLSAVAIEHRQLTDQLSHQAQHDALTGLPNRLLFRDRLGQALALAKRHRQQVAVLYMDMDRFKQINDTLGHSSGDALLRQAAIRLGNCLRKSDTLARLGGDEFTVVLTELGDARHATQVASKLVEAMRIPFEVDGRELFVSVSLGISIYPQDGLDGETLMANADVAMYRAKDGGRDNFQWFAAEMNTLARERMALDGHLRRAMELGQLSLHYQPQCAASGEIQALEALMRWHHPTLGMVPPARFIPLAEDSGLIVPMGEWALRHACAQAAAWRRSGFPSLRISVNVSPVQFRRSDWVDTVRRALKDSQLDPEALELEITESLLLQNVKETSSNLFDLRALGVGVAIDDFGTGYSSLSYLHKLPVTTLKIDQSFVREIGLQAAEGHEEAPIIRTIIALAHNLGMAVVAEGVETESQRSLLIELGCESLQGYLLHAPLDVVGIEALLLSKRKD